MKTLIITTILAMSVLFTTGCSSKQAVTDEESEKAKKVETETVKADESKVVESDETKVEDSSEKALAEKERELQTIYFDYDKFNIRSDMQDRMTTDANIANKEAKKFKIKLEGNCDEWGSDEYNFALGLRRANTVKKSLVAEGVEENRISMVSYGESNPVCTDKTHECWAKNRRVDFKLLP